MMYALNGIQITFELRLYAQFERRTAYYISRQSQRAEFDFAKHCRALNYTVYGSASIQKLSKIEAFMSALADVMLGGGQENPDM